MDILEKCQKYQDLINEAFGDEKKLKKVVDKLVKENISHADKLTLIYNIFKEQPICLRYVDYQTLQKYDNEKNTLLKEMLVSANVATGLPMEEFYENFISESLKRSDNKAFLDYILSNYDNEANLLTNPNFVKTQGVTEKHWESIKQGHSISADDKVDTFVSHLANLKTLDKIVEEVAEFVKDPELNFSENEILKVLNKNKALLKDTRIMSALVEKSTQEKNEGFDSSEFERLIKKNKSTFNKYLKETTINKENRKTLNACFENIDKETLTQLFGSMSKANQIEYSVDIVGAVTDFYENKKFVKNQDNSIAYVKGGGDLNKIPKKLRSNHVTASLAKHYATEYAKTEDFTLSKLFAKMELFDKKHVNSVETLDAIAKSDFYKNSSIQNKREFLSKCNKSYLSDNLQSIIKNDPACLFVKKGDSFTPLVGQNIRENTLWALNSAVQKVDATPFKDFVSSLPDEVLANKKMMKEMLARVLVQSRSSNFVKDFFESLDYKNKNVKENLSDILNFTVNVNPHVLEIVKEQASDILGSILKTKVGNKILFKAIMVDPVSVNLVEGGDLSEKLANLKIKQRFVIAQSCISKLANKGYDKKYEEILASVFALDDNGLSKGQVKKLLSSLAKNNAECFVNMYVSNVFSESKNPHVSKILEDNFAKHKNIFGKKLEEKYVRFTKDYDALYNECNLQKIKQTQKQVQILKEKIIVNYSRINKYDESVEKIEKCTGKKSILREIKNFNEIIIGDKAELNKIFEDNKDNSVQLIRKKLSEFLVQKSQKFDEQNEKYIEPLKEYAGVLNELGAQEVMGDAACRELDEFPFWTKDEFTTNAKGLENIQTNLVKFNELVDKYNLGEIVPVKPALDLNVKFVYDFEKNEEIEEKINVVENLVSENKIEPNVEIKTETNQVEEDEEFVPTDKDPILSIDLFIINGGDFSMVDKDEYFQEVEISDQEKNMGFTKKDSYIIYGDIIGRGRYKLWNTKYSMEERRKNLFSLIDSLSPNAKKYPFDLLFNQNNVMKFAMDKAFNNAQKAEFLAKFENVFLRSKDKDDIDFITNLYYISSWQPQMIFAKDSKGKSVFLSEEFLKSPNNVNQKKESDFVTEAFDELNRQFAEMTRWGCEHTETEEYQNLTYFATSMPEEFLKDKNLLKELINVAKSKNSTQDEFKQWAYVAKDKDALYAFAQGLSENPNFGSMDPSILKMLAKTNNFVSQIKGFENMTQLKGGSDGEGQSL